RLFGSDLAAAHRVEGDPVRVEPLHHQEAADEDDAPVREVVDEHRAEHEDRAAHPGGEAAVGEIAGASHGCVPRQPGMRPSELSASIARTSSSELASSGTTASDGSSESSGSRSPTVRTWASISA